MSKTVLILKVQFSISMLFKYQKVLFQTIPFIINIQFSSILIIDRTLSGTTYPGQSRPGSGANEGVFYNSKDPTLLRFHHEIV